MGTGALVCWGKMSVVTLEATPTQGKFMLSTATIVALIGAMGEGKSYAAVMALIAHAGRCKALFKPGEKLQCAIIRDTHENIKHSVVKTFEIFFADHPEIKHKWRNDYKSLDIHTDPGIHCDLFGIDDTAALTKLQGSTYGLIWLEEIAPYTDTHRSNAGISEDVFNAALVRCARQDTAFPRLQMTTNPCDEDHWFYQRILVPPDGPVHKDLPLITKEVFQIPYGENIHLREISRQATKAAFIGDEAAYARYVSGEVATKFPGEAVTRGYFNEDWHVAPDEIEIVQGWDGWVSFDSWGNPAAIIGQQAPNGRITVTDVLQGSGDIRGLIRDYIKPLFNTPRYKNVAATWTLRLMGDGTMLQPDQSNQEQSAARYVEEAFLDHAFRPLMFEPGPSTWQHVRTGMLHSLRWTIGGGPAVLLDPVHTKPLIAGLKGRWHYAKNKGGYVNRVRPVKNDASHVCDAFANAMCVLCAWDPPKRRNTSNIVNMHARRRSESYVTDDVAAGVS